MLSVVLLHCNDGCHQSVFRHEYLKMATTCVCVCVCVRSRATLRVPFLMLYVTVAVSLPFSLPLCVKVFVTTHNSVLLVSVHSDGHSHCCPFKPTHGGQELELIQKKKKLPSVFT